MYYVIRRCSFDWDISLYDLIDASTDNMGEPNQGLADTKRKAKLKVLPRARPPPITQ